MSESSAPGRKRVVIVGGGFAGYHAAKKLSRRIGDTAEIVIVNPTDYFLYLPLLPEVSSGRWTLGGSPSPLPRPCPRHGWFWGPSTRLTFRAGKSPTWTR